MVARQFDKWIDLEAKRRIEGQITSNVSHSARRDVGLVAVDFGSTPTEASIELFDIVDVSGMNSMIVSSARE